MRRTLTSLASVGALAGLLVVLGACGDDGPAAAVAPTVVGVETQRCRQPNRFRAVGTVVGDDADGVLVATAGHTVEGDLRELRVDGRPAAVVALDRRSDLALLRIDGAAGGVTTPAELATAIPATARLVTHGGEAAVTIDRHVTFVVEHVSDGATYRRDTVVIGTPVEPGTSGAPLLDAAGRLVAIVFATEGGETFAVTFNEVAALLGERDAHRPDGRPC